MSKAECTELDRMNRDGPYTSDLSERESSGCRNALLMFNRSQNEEKLRGSITSSRTSSRTSSSVLKEVEPHQVPRKQDPNSLIMSGHLFQKRSGGIPMRV